MASIHERQRRKGVVFMVSWRDPSGCQRTKSFGRRREAESFARRVEVEKEDGRYSDPAAGRVTIAQFWGTQVRLKEERLGIADDEGRRSKCTV